VVLQAHHRLLEQDQAVLVERVAQFLRPVDALVGRAQVFGRLVEQYVAVAPAILGLVHRNVHVREQRERVPAVEGVERDARGRRQVRDHLVVRGLEAVVPHRVERLFGDLDRVLAQGRGQVDRELVAAEPEQLGRQAARDVAQHAPDPDDQLVAGAVPEMVVHVLEVIDVEKEQRADAARLQRRLDAPLQAQAVRKIGQRIMQREVLDALRRQVLLGDVARGAADAEHGAVVVEHHAGVDADPAVIPGMGDEPGHVMLDFAVALQRRQEAAVGDMGIAGLEIEEAAPDQVLGRDAEDRVGGGVEIGEAPEGVGCPDEVVRGLDQVAVAVLALQQELDDAPLLGERLADRRQLLAGLVARGGEAGARQAVDQLARIAPVPAVRAARDQHALLVPAPQLLDRNGEHLGHLLDAVFRGRIAHALSPDQLGLSGSGRRPCPIAC